MKKILGGVTVPAIAVAVLLATASLAAASTASVSSTPGAMPYVTSTDATVRQIAQCGQAIYSVGSFSTVAAAGGSSITRNNVFSFNATTGVITSWNPNVNGEVNSIAFTDDCASAYLGGAFTSVHGTAVANLAKVDTSTGVVDTTFAAAPNAEVDTVVQTGGRLIVGGLFTSIGGVARPIISAVDLATGAASSYLKLNVQGTLPDSVRKIYNFALSPDHTRLLAMGSFLTVGGIARQQIFMIDLGATATLDPWYSPDFSMTCAASEPFWAQAAAWSPDGLSVYVATTGYRGNSPLCDASAKFSSAANSNLSAVWINKTGCDSLYAIAADDTFVYVAGHQRWLSNQFACDSKGAGAADRPGVGSISVSTGVVTSWDPTRGRGKGADDLLLTPAGLWIASDTFFNTVKCAGAYHPGICYFPH